MFVDVVHEDGDRSFDRSSGRTAAPDPLPPIPCPVGSKWPSRPKSSSGSLSFAWLRPGPPPTRHWHLAHHLRHGAEQRCRPVLETSTRMVLNTINASEGLIHVASRLEAIATKVEG